jgi:hypothetical protein
MIAECRSRSGHGEKEEGVSSIAIAPAFFPFDQALPSLRSRT